MQYSYLNTSIEIDQKYAEMNIIEKLTWEQWNAVGVGNIEEMRKRRGRKLKWGEESLHYRGKGFSKPITELGRAAPNLGN